MAYGQRPPVAGGLGVVDGWIVADDVERLAIAGGGTAATGPDGRILPVAELAIPGAHNVSNALAAIAVGLLFGVEPDAIRAAAAAFTGVEHRLEPVATIDGVRFVNDSQGTQPDAVVAALRSFEPPVVLIAGGRDKGVDLSGLPPVVAERAVAAVLIGESGPRLEADFRAAGLERTARAATLEQAVRVAAFDFSVWELWGALRTAGAWSSCRTGCARRRRRSTGCSCEERVTVLNQTPSAFRQLVRADEGRRDGEALALRLRDLRRRGAGCYATLRAVAARGTATERPRLVNMYGITETTVHVTYRAGDGGGGARGGERHRRADAGPAGVRAGRAAGAGAGGRGRGAVRRRRGAGARVPGSGRS